MANQTSQRIRLVAIGVFAVALVAQSPDSAVTVRLTDHTGAVIPFVGVVLRNVQSGEVKTLTRSNLPTRATLPSGTYEISLTPNRYTQPLVRSRISLEASADALLDLVAYLKPGWLLDVGQQIEIKGVPVRYETIELRDNSAPICIAYRSRTERGRLAEYGGGASTSPDGGLATLTYGFLTITAQRFTLDAEARTIYGAGAVKAWGRSGRSGDAVDIDLASKMMRWPDGRLTSLQ